MSEDPQCPAMSGRQEQKSLQTCRCPWTTWTYRPRISEITVCRLQYETTEHVFWITTFCFKFPRLKTVTEIYLFTLKENPKQPVLWKCFLKYYKKYGVVFHHCWTRQLWVTEILKPLTRALKLKCHHIFGKSFKLGILIFILTFMTCSDATAVHFNFRSHTWLSR